MDNLNVQFSKKLALGLSTTMLIFTSDVFSVPTELIIDVSEKKVTYHAVGGSRVEHKWPKTGVVCTHDRDSSARVCNNLQPGEHYEIVDLHDKKKRTFFLYPDAPMKNGVCLAGST